MIVRQVEIPRCVRREETFAVRLRRVRLARGWSQEHLAALSEIDRQTVWAAERGSDVHAWVLERLADALGTTMDALWHGETDRSAQNDQNG